MSVRLQRMFTDARREQRKWLACWAVTTFGVIAHADAQTTDPRQMKVEEIVVTSSRLARQDVPTPVTVVSAEMLGEGARPNIVAALVDLPQFKASWSPQITGGSFTAGSYAVDLRGLGPARTLVLLGGKRLAGSYANGIVGPDLAVIPSVLVRRVDVVTGGASAAWGSNAVAGVVNMVLDDEFEGVRFGVRTGGSSRSDARENQVESAAGFSFSEGRGRVLLGGEFVDNDGAEPKTSRKNVGRWATVTNPNAANGERPLMFASDVGFADASVGGLILTGVNAGQTFNPDGTLRPFDFGRISGSTSIGGEGPSLDDYLYLTAPTQRYSALAQVSYELGESVTLTADVLHSRAYDDYRFSIDTSTRGNITISVENPFLPAAVRNQMVAAGQTSFRMGRLGADFARTQNDYSRETTQAFLSIDGDIGSSGQWSAYYSRGWYGEDVELSNSIVRANFTSAADAVVSPTTGQPICRIALTDPTTACVPINLFGEGAPSEAATRYVTGSRIQHLRQTLDTAGLSLRGEPFESWAGPVSAAIGIEGRREEIDQTVGALDLARAFQSNFAPVKGDSTTKEAFTEVLFPLVKDVPLLKLLQFNGAARMTDDPTGSIWSWKLGLTDQITDGFQLRATHSQDIRAPSLIELYSPSATSLGGIVDPQTNTTYQTRTILGGNPNLSPETSLATTVGFTFTPASIPSFSFTADYFDIDIDDAIALSNPQSTVDLCFRGIQNACSAITRGPDGLIATIAANQLNLSTFSVTGVDAMVNYSMPAFAGGRFKLRGNVTWMREFEQDTALLVTDGLATQGAINFGVPRLTGNVSIGYENDRFEVYVRDRYISSGKYNGTQSIVGNELPAYNYADVGLKYMFSGRTNMELSANVNNVFDKDPPVASQTSAYYDVIGRYWSVGVDARF